MIADSTRIAALRDRLWQSLQRVPGVELNGDPTRRVAGILNVSIEGVEGESLLCALADLAVSSGSACASTNAEASYVLRALGRSDQLAQSSLRFSLGRFSTDDEVECAATRVRDEVLRLRAHRARPRPTGRARRERRSALQRRGAAAAARHAGRGDLPEGAGMARGRAGDREQGAGSVRIRGPGRPGRARPVSAHSAARISGRRVVADRAPARGHPGRLAGWDWREAADALDGAAGQIRAPAHGSGRGPRCRRELARPDAVHGVEFAPAWPSSGES